VYPYKNFKHMLTQCRYDVKCSDSHFFNFDFNKNYLQSIPASIIIMSTFDVSGYWEDVNILMTTMIGNNIKL